MPRCGDPGIGLPTQIPASILRLVPRLGNKSLLTTTWRSGVYEAAEALDYTGLRNWITIQDPEFDWLASRREADDNINMSRIRLSRIR